MSVFQSPLRIAVWGLGSHALRNVLPAIDSSPDVELVGVCSRDAAKGRAVVDRHGGTSWYNADTMLADERVDLVYVATPTGLHPAHAAAALTACKHVICEKSLTATEHESLALVELAAERDLVLIEALMFLHHPRFRAIRHTVRSDAFGTVHRAFCWFTLPPLESPGFRTSHALGGGALLDVGCYPLAMIRSLADGQPRVGLARMGDGAEAAAGVDRAGDAVLELENGAWASVAWAYEASYAAELIVLGTEQSLYATRVFGRETGAAGSIVLRDRRGNPSPVEIPETNAFVDMFADAWRAAHDAVLRASLRDDAAAQARLLGEVQRRAGAS